jgi:hypothetical protein
MVKAAGFEPAISSVRGRRERPGFPMPCRIGDLHGTRTRRNRLDRPTASPAASQADCVSRLDQNWCVWSDSNGHWTRSRRAPSADWGTDAWRTRWDSNPRSIARRLKRPIPLPLGSLVRNWRTRWDSHPRRGACAPVGLKARSDRCSGHVSGATFVADHAISCRWCTSLESNQRRPVIGRVLCH